MSQVKIISYFRIIGGGQFQTVLPEENPDLDNSVIYISGNYQQIGSRQIKKFRGAVTLTPLLDDRFENISTDEIFGDLSMIETPTTSMLSTFETRAEDLEPSTSELPPSGTTAEDLGPSTSMLSTFETRAEDLEPSTSELPPSGTTAEDLGPSTSKLTPSGTKAEDLEPSASELPRSETRVEDLEPSTSEIPPSRTRAEDLGPSTELVSPPENEGRVIRSASDLFLSDEDTEICNYQRQLGAFLEINNQFWDQTLKLQNNLKKKLFKYETKVSRIKKRTNKLIKYGEMAINLKTLYKDINK
ncbi:unnamed protein product [Psylliodes chrysocephalus]|uniref:Uncharacterized protein n=1 Tax=Psylliodes chrysocephalus TaxID=3402493 RepID=A0A9P0DAC0_9CUCU|nr:unnamed protein product [Psylliodes chrysocephala]